MRFNPNRPVSLSHNTIYCPTTERGGINYAKISNEMKQREQSGCLDFGPIRVQLTATGKELNDLIAFLDNLKAQLESVTNRIVWTTKLYFGNLSKEEKMDIAIALGLTDRRVSKYIHDVKIARRRKIQRQEQTENLDLVVENSLDYDASYKPLS
ncbi:unnamed protein product [Caenorhabditis nigoni]